MAADLQRAKRARLATVEVRQIFGLINEAKGDPSASEDSVNDFLDGLGPFSRLEVDIIQPLWTFGRLAAGQRAALHGLSARNEGVKALRGQVAKTVIDRYDSVLLTGEILRFLSGIARDLERAEKKIRRRLDELEQLDEAELDGEVLEGVPPRRKLGEPERRDLLSVELAQSRLARRLRELEVGRTLALDGLKMELGLRGETPLVLAERRLKPMAHALAPLEEYLAKLQEGSRLQQAREGVRAREAELEVMEREDWPVLFAGFFFRYGIAPNRDDQKNPFAFDPWNTIEPGLVLGLRWKPELWGPFPAQARGLAELRKARSQLRQAEMGLRIELKKAWLEAVKAKADLGSAAQGKRAARGLVLLAGTDFLGSARTESHFRALEAHVEESLGYFRAVHAYNIAIAELWRAAGENPLPHLGDNPGRPGLEKGTSH